MISLLEKTNSRFSRLRETAQNEHIFYKNHDVYNAMACMASIFLSEGYLE